MKKENDFETLLTIRRFERKLKVTGQDIDDIMVSALEGGINYWCRIVEVSEDNYYGEFASDQISRDGSLWFYDIEEPDKYFLNRDMFMTGLAAWCAEYAEEYHFIRNEHNECMELECGMIDAGDADTIVQLALFGELMFG